MVRYGKRSEFKADKGGVIFWSDYVLIRFDDICFSNAKLSALDFAKITSKNGVDLSQRGYRIAMAFGVLFLMKKLF